MKKDPCDYEPHVCPYDAQYSEDCRYHCGVGVDEAFDPEEEEEYEQG